MEFTSRKFLALPIERQHKKLALLLRSAYLRQIKGENSSDYLALYEQYAGWMGIPAHLANTLKELADTFHMHAKLASFSLREHSLLPKTLTQDASQKKDPLPYFVYLDNLRSAFNVGSIIRTAECFGFSKVFFSKDTPNHLCTKVQKSAMGTQDWIECVIDHDQLPKPLIVLETVPDAPSIFEFKFPGTFTLVMGNEEYGVSDKMLSQADYFVQIPLMGRKGSLNVANAFAIAAAVASQSNMPVPGKHQSSLF